MLTKAYLFDINKVKTVILRNTTIQKYSFLIYLYIYISIYSFLVLYIYIYKATFSTAITTVFSAT